MQIKPNSGATVLLVVGLEVHYSTKIVYQKFVQLQVDEL